MKSENLTDPLQYFLILRNYSPLILKDKNLKLGSFTNFKALFTTAMSSQLKSWILELKKHLKTVNSMHYAIGGQAVKSTTTIWHYIRIRKSTKNKLRTISSYAAHVRRHKKSKSRSSYELVARKSEQTNVCQLYTKISFQIGHRPVERYARQDKKN